jgi:hypothetical protein
MTSGNLPRMTSGNLPRAIVEVRFGPLQGRKVVLDAGERLSVGRTERAALSFPHDRRLSAVHFELAWDGERCHVQDLGSLGGTFIDGQPLGAGSVGHGGWVKGGDTVLMVYSEAKTPPRPGADVAWTGAKQRALDALSAEADPLFAVLDSARRPRVPELLRESAEEYRSLYDGLQAESLASVAPYLVRLPRGTRLLPRLVREGWGHRFGIYLTHPGSLAEVRAHLRRFLMVENEVTRRRLYFRYYDPAVLRLFLPTCSALQREDFFRQISSFSAESRGGDVLRFTQSGAAGLRVAASAPAGA